jgi:hypothetical protein
MACKSYGDVPESHGELKDALIQSFRIAKTAGRTSITIRELLEGNLQTKYADRQQEFLFSATEVLEELVTSEEELEAKYERIA